MKKSKTLIGLSAMALLLISCQGNQAPKAVDMGLSVKWATCNIGATTPEDPGNYYAWGEVVPKPVYDRSTYLFYNNEKDYITQYCYDGHRGVVDNKLELEPNNDVARQRLGKQWYMPTNNEWEELLDRNNCIWEWANQNATKGFLITSKITGNSIFLPAAGYRDEENLDGMGVEGLYWSSSLSSGWRGPGEGDCIYFDKERARSTSESRYYGLSVRPVKGRISRPEKAEELLNEETQNRIIRAFRQIPDHKKVEDRAREYMTEDLYNALVVAWDVSQWASVKGMIGDEEHLYYFVSGNGDWGAVSRIEIVSIKEIKKKYYVELVEHGQYESKTHSLIMIRGKEGLLMDDFDGNKEWCTKYIKKETTAFLSGETIKQMEQDSWCDDSDITRVNTLFNTFLSQHKDYIEKLIERPVPVVMSRY